MWRNCTICKELFTNCIFSAHLLTKVCVLREYGGIFAHCIRRLAFSSSTASRCSLESGTSKEMDPVCHDGKRGADCGRCSCCAARVPARSRRRRQRGISAPRRATHLRQPRPAGSKIRPQHVTPPRAARCALKLASCPLCSAPRAPRNVKPKQRDARTSMSARRV